MDNIFKSYSIDNLKWYKSKINLDYLQMYSRNIQKDLIHRCDFITASSHNKELFQYFLKDLDFTNSNQKNIDISSIWLFNCGDIDNFTVSVSNISGKIIYDFACHVSNSNWIDFLFKPFQFVVFQNDNPNSVQSIINVYGLAFRAQQICDFSIKWLLLFVLFGANLCSFPDYYDWLSDIEKDFLEENNTKGFEAILGDNPELLDLLKSSNGIAKEFHNNLRFNTYIIWILQTYIITRFDYCFDFFMKKWVNHLDIYKFFNEKDVKFTPYSWDSEDISKEFEDFIHYDKKWHMDTWWIKYSNNLKWIHIRNYDKQIKIIENGENDFYSDYMDSSLKVRRLEFEFHSDFTRACDKITWYDSSISLFNELEKYTLSKKVLEYLWLSEKTGVFYKKYPVIVNWDNRTNIWKYKFIKKFHNSLKYIIDNQVPVSLFFQMYWLDSSLLEKAYNIEFKKSCELSKKIIDKNNKLTNQLKNQINKQIKNHSINSPIWMDDLEKLKKRLS